MDTLINKVIKNKLSDFTKSKEKNEIISYLVLLGFEYYDLLYSNQELNVDNLKFLSKKYLNELNTLKPLTPHFNISLSDMRKYRPDSMAHYPFVDDKGSVKQILQSDKIDIDSTQINKSISKVSNIDSEPQYSQAHSQSNMQISDEMKFEEKLVDEANKEDNDFPETLNYHQHPSRTTRYRKSPVKSEEQQFIQNLKKIPSRISQIVQHDKRFYKQKLHERNQSALKTIAQRRVDALTSTAVPLGFKDRHYFSEPDPSLTYIKSNHPLHKTKEPQLFHSVPTHNHKHPFSTTVSMKKGSTSNYKRYSDLDTGLATMEIADAFLQGNVGREILTIPESDYSYYNSTQPGEIYSSNNIIPNTNNNSNRFERTTQALQGIHTKPGSDTRYAPNTNYTNRIASKPNIEDSYKKYIQPSEDIRYDSYLNTSNYFHKQQQNSQSYKHYSKGNLNKNIQQQPQPQQSYMDYGLKTEHEKRIDQKLNEQAKRLYTAPGWKSSKGGWVADFGPPHTHALYTGPEINYPSAIPSSTSSYSAVHHNVIKDDMNTKTTNYRATFKVPSTYDRDITRKSFENQMLQSDVVDEGSSNSDTVCSDVIYDPIPNTTKTINPISTTINNDKNVQYNKSRFTSITNHHHHHNNNNEIVDDGSFSIDTAVAGAGEGAVSTSVYRNISSSTMETPAVTMSASEYIRNTTPSVESPTNIDAYYNEIRNSTMPISNMDNIDNSD